MAQDLTAKKSDFASAAVQMADRILSLARSCEEFASYYFANTLNSGGANAIAQSDLVGANAHLTPAVVGSVVTAAVGVRDLVTQAMRDNLRQADTKPQS